MHEGKDFLVGEEYFGIFLSGNNTFTELLEMFDKVGKQWKDRILDKIEKAAKEMYYWVILKVVV